MVAGNVARIVHAPGRVVVDPTNLSAAYPHGGTEVGKTNAFALQPFGEVFRVEYEGLGEAGDILEANKSWRAAFFLRGFDDDAIEQLTSWGYVVGGVSQHATFNEPGNKVPGESALLRAKKVLYVPDDLIHTPAILIYRGVADWTVGAEIAFQRGEELGIPITVDCVRDTNGNMLTVGRFADLSLT